jgi:tetratricopeptide (TPR) repeat protein
MTPKLNYRRALLALVTALAVSAFATRGAAQVDRVAVSRIPEAADPLNQKAALARADSAWEAGGYPLAAQLYEAILARDPSSHISLYRLATLRAWDGRFDEGIALFRRYVAVEPDYTEGRMALARTIAWSGNYSSAIAIYDSVLTRQPTYRDAVLGRAQTLAWAGRLNEALPAYKQWVAAHPTDRNASLEYARALAWNGQMDEAEMMYTELSKTGNANAKKGLARVLGWRGELERSERTWREVLVTDPADPEALTGLAQVLSWQGRQADAETALQAALRANPAYGDARTLMRWVQADLKPSVTIAGLGTNDSDNNRSTSFVLDYVERAPWNGTVGVKYIERWANFAAIDSRADAFNTFARWQPAATSWQFRVDAGVTRHSTTFAPVTAREKTILNGALSTSGTVGRSLTLRMGASRAPFDETALLIANGVLISELAGEAEFALPSRFTLSGAASNARLTHGTRENTRNAFSTTLRWTRSRNWSLAVGARQFGYDTTSSDGYFAPKKYTLAEASGRGRIGGQLGWNADADVGLGQQRIEFFGSNAGSRLAERVAMSLGYRFDPAHEISAAGGYANVAAPGQTSGSEYKWYTFSLRARFGF